MKIKKAIYEELKKYCRENFPFESCGILAGKDCLATEIYKLKNISDNPQVCYQIEPKEQLNIFKLLRKKEVELLAIFHSHIGVEAYPSKRDVELAFYPDSSYLILSLQNKVDAPMIRSFKIQEGKIEEESLEIV